MTPMGHLQQGIYLAAGERSPPCWRLMLLNVSSGAVAGDVHEGLAHILRMLADLGLGRVRELEGQPPEHARASADQFAGLATLVAFGRRLFDAERHDPQLTTAPRPPFLAYLPEGAALAGLPWSSRNGDAAPSGEADIALQLTAERQAGVNCGAVEVWKLIGDHDLPFVVSASFSGFGRHDGRGWLEFHDGVSNLPAEDRLDALSASGDPPWMAGGTYLAFLRLGVDLATWRNRGRAQQELLVGRDKLSGAALVATTRASDGTVLPVPGLTPDSMAGADDRIDWIDPPQTTDPLLEASHIHRANQNRASAAAPGSLRMYRQGYDFLDEVGPSGPVAGLNFISFQRDLQIFQHVLHLPGWLGEVSFGGPAEPQPGEPVEPRFLSLLAGGLYAVPPRRDPFPGADLLT